MNTSVSVNVDSIEALEKYIARIRKYRKMQTDKKFQEYIKNKVMNTLLETMRDKLVPQRNENTNSEYFDLYWESNHIEDTIDGRGFILYNDAKIPANVNGTQNVPENYPEGMFSIALAFEYGVGIVGMNTEYDETKYLPWEYNKKNYNFGWYLPADISNYYGLSKNLPYAGYEGYEVYRWTATRVEERLPQWVNSYLELKGE
jgi:hypothetical protein